MESAHISPTSGGPAAHCGAFRVDLDDMEAPSSSSSSSSSAAASERATTDVKEESTTTAKRSVLLKKTEEEDEDEDDAPLPTAAASAPAAPARAGSVPPPTTTGAMDVDDGAGAKVPIVAQSEDCSEALQAIESDPWDATSWVVFVQEVAAGRGGPTVTLVDVYTRFLDRFPRAGKYWKDLAEYHVRTSQDYAAAEEVGTDPLLPHAVPRFLTLFFSLSFATLSAVARRCTTSAW